MKFLFSKLYDFLLIIIACASLPKYLLKRKKLASLFFHKWGSSFRFIEKNDKPLIWIHAVSVGETKAVAALARHFRETYSEAQIVVTSITETGQAEARRSIPFAQHHLFLPFDFSWIIKPIMQRLKPELVLLSETDYWYHFASFAKENGAKFALINGKMSQKSYQRFNILRRWTASFFASIDHFSLQSAQHSKRFLALGIPQEKISISGNLKIDAPVKTMNDPEQKAFYGSLGFNDKDQVLVAGSTHPGEEKIILDLFQNLSPQFPHLRLVIAPRHPERFQEINRLIRTYPFSSKTLTEGQQPAQIVLINAMGLLQSCYQISDIAIVGGSFTPKVGGHNILEPCPYGKPVVFGPYMYNQTDLAELALEHEAGIQTNSGELEEKVRLLLLSPERRKQIGSNGIRLVKSTLGASWQVFTLLEEKLQLRQNLNVAEKESKKLIFDH